MYINTFIYRIAISTRLGNWLVWGWISRNKIWVIFNRILNISFRSFLLWFCVMQFPNRPIYFAELNRFIFLAKNWLHKCTRAIFSQICTCHLNLRKVIFLLKLLVSCTVMWTDTQRYRNTILGLLVYEYWFRLLFSNQSRFTRF